VIQAIVTAPANTVARVGSWATLNCTVTGDVDNSEYVTWNYYEPGSNVPVRIFTSNRADVKHRHRIKFDIEHDDQHGVFNLLIKSVQLDVAVLYYCELVVKGEKAAAKLVAVSTSRSLLVMLFLTQIYGITNYMN